MDDKLVNIIYTELLLNLMTENQQYNVTIDTEFGEKKYTLIKDEDNGIQFYEDGQVGNA